MCVCVCHKNQQLRDMNVSLVKNLTAVHSYRYILHRINDFQTVARTKL